MRAAILKKFGGPEMLQLEEIPRPKLQEGEALVRMKAMGLNFADIYRRRGEATIHGGIPHILGHEGAGIVEEIQGKSSDIQIGSRVAFAHVPRANAEWVAAPLNKLVPLPKFISFEEAAAIMLQGMTAHYLLFGFRTLNPDETILNLAAAGGVGILLTQIARILNQRVIGVVSNQEKSRLAKEFGAEEVIISPEYDFVDETLRLTKQKGVDMVFDGIGSTLEKSLRAVRARGHVVLYGSAGGKTENIPISLLDNGSKTLSCGGLWDFIATREELLMRANALFQWMSEKKLKVHISHQLSLKEISKAHKLLETRKSTGKIILVV